MKHPIYIDERLPEPTGREDEPQIYLNRIAAGAAWKGCDFPDYLSCHPKTWEAMDEKEPFENMGTIYKNVCFTMPEE